MVNWHKYCWGIWDIVTDSRIIDVVSDLLGDTVVLRHSHLFAKLLGDPKRVSWHQDASYWPLTRHRVVSTRSRNRIVKNRHAARLLRPPDRFSRHAGPVGCPGGWGDLGDRTVAAAGASCRRCR